MGAGPAGLSAALLLAKREGWRRIVVLERRPSLASEEAEKSYVYMIDHRGREVTDAAGVTQAVLDAGMSPKFVDLVTVEPDGSSKERRISIKTDAGDAAFNAWLPRRAFLSALQTGLVPAEVAGRVRLLHSTEVTSITLPSQGTGAGAALHGRILVHATDYASGESMAFAPRLLVGADGINSVVRKSLEAWAPSAGRPQSDFQPVVLQSPSTGLRFKVLHLPPNAPYYKAGGAPGQRQEAGRIDNARFGAVVGVRAPPLRSMRLGLLPLRDPHAPRSINIIKQPGHEVWTKTTGPELRDFLQESFPQLDISSLLSDTQLDAAAAGRGGVFPPPQYLRHFTAVVPPTPAAPTTAPTAASGVVLVGDAVHCFPPDLGQGVNSSLADVAELAKGLDESKGDLSKALPAFEARRAPEAKALAELMTFSYPWQYGQDMTAKTLWGVNLALRALLSRIAPWAFSPHSFLMVQQPGLSYQQILAKAHATTARMWALAAALAVALIAFAVRAVVSAMAGAPVAA